MTRKLTHLLMLLTLCMSTCLFTACPGDDDESSGESTEEDINYNSYYTNLLKGTSWVITKSTTTKNGEVTVDNNIGASILSFSDVLYEADWHTDKADYYKLYSTIITSSGRVQIPSNTFSGFWYCYDDNKLSMWSDFGDLTASQRGYFSMGFAPGKGQEIVSLTSSSLHLRFTSDPYVYDRYYTKTSSSGNSGGSSTTYEKPEVGFYDFTATTSSLKVQYKIYNSDEAKVTSAKIYYGTTSNPTKSVTATVGSAIIYGNISGLKAGTTYYVKCTATGKGGTTTTSVTKCVTNSK